MDDDGVDWRVQAGQCPRYFVSEAPLTEIVVERDKVEVCLAKQTLRNRHRIGDSQVVGDIYPAEDFQSLNGVFDK